MLTVEESEPGRVIVFKGPGPRDRDRDGYIRKTFGVLGIRILYRRIEIRFVYRDWIGGRECWVLAEYDWPPVPAKIYADVLAINEAAEDCWYSEDKIFIGG